MRLLLICLILVALCAGVAIATGAEVHRLRWLGSGGFPSPTAEYTVMDGRSRVRVYSGAAPEAWFADGSQPVYRDTMWFSGKPLHLGALPKLSFRDNFTLAARVKLKEAAFGQVVGASGSGGLVVSLDQIKLAIWGSDWVLDATLPENEWIFVAVTMDSAHAARAFVNGHEVGSAKVNAWPKDPENWTIGGWDVGEGFRGDISRVMIWNTALKPEETKHVAALMGLDKPAKITTDEPALVSKTPGSVRAMAKELKDLAVEPDQLSRYPFSAMLGFDRFGQALRLRSYKQRAEAEKWLADEIPTFDCPDPIWKRCYYYRWFLVRANYAEADGVPGFYEGKRGVYRRHITYSAPHIMDEVRWLADGKYAYGQADILGKRREPDGRRFGGYTHWIASTLWGAYLVHPDRKRLAELLPAWQEDTMCAFPGKLDTTRPDADYLLAPPNHWVTGMEWQPAWFYFDNYDRTKETRLSRPDYTAYYYANARAVADALRVLGKKYEAAKFDKLADRIKGAVENVMWDPKTNFFYSVKVGTQEIAWVRECVGIYPFAFGLPDKNKSAAFSWILTKDDFWGPWPITTCSMRCPMYTPKVKLCNWNGPVWPHAESIVANAMANGLRDYGAYGVTPEKIYQLMDGYTKLQYEDKGTWKKPNVHEEGNADDGQMYGCPDYFHSTYNDLIIRLVGGLMPRNDDTVELYPVVGAPWDHFRLDRVPYRGHKLSIVWDNRTKGRYAGAPKGYSLYVDGKLIGTKPKLQHVTFKYALKGKR